MSKEYHILALSGGKDSAALAFYIKENMPQIHKKIEYVFCDTEHEIPETYDYLNKLELFLNKKITKIKPEKNFDHIMATNNFLPSYRHRWCTGLLKTQPLERYIKKLKSADKISQIFLYIGIRADEIFRTKSAGKNPLLKEVFPFVENNIYKNDVINILKNSGIGLPDYYKWRKRSGCYFCFYQSCSDWLNLYENHPDLYHKAMEYEYNDCTKIKNGRMGFNMKYALKDMIKPENIEKIRKMERKSQTETEKKNITLFSLFLDETL